jgi:hypothetical protein
MTEQCKHYVKPDPGAVHISNICAATKELNHCIFATIVNNPWTQAQTFCKYYEPKEKLGLQSYLDRGKVVDVDHINMHLSQGDTICYYRNDECYEEKHMICVITAHNALLRITAEK